MEKYYCRVCLNTLNWQQPSGDACWLETKYAEPDKRSYARRYGFGHEEWLFNFDWTINGYMYSFLQPVNKSGDKHIDKHLYLKLYTVKPYERRFIAEMRKCLIIAEEESKRA